MSEIMVVDDDADLRALISSSLAARGFTVTVFATLAEAEAGLAARSPSLIVVDGVLPDGRGVDFIERLRARDRVVPIVFVSALVRDLETFTRLTGELAVAMVVYKPLELDGFITRVVALLDGPPAAAPVPPPAPGYASELAELRRQFAARLPDKLAELTAAVWMARQVPFAVEAARSIAHRLRGSAGSYGHAAISDAVGRIDELLGEAPTQSMWDDVDAALRDASAALVKPGRPQER